MRRFEFSEGSSNKFWQIERNNNSFTVVWGKIGTAGQSQVKDFPTEAKAIAEHDKLINEKVKKGYVEVGASAATPAPPPAARPAPAAPAPVAAAPAAAAPVTPAPLVAPAPAVATTLPQETGEIAWDDAARAEVHPSRAFPPPTPIRPDLQKGAASLVAACKEQTELWQGLVSVNPGEVGDWIKAAARRIPNPAFQVSAWSPPTDVKVEAVLYHLLLTMREPKIEAISGLLGQWVAQAGLDFAIEALAFTEQFWWQGDWNKPQVLVLGRQSSSCSSYYTYNRGFLPPAHYLRCYLATVPEADYARALALAHTLFAEDVNKKLMAYLFPDSDLPSQLTTPQGVDALSLMSPDKVEEAIKRSTYELHFRLSAKWRDDAVQDQACLTLLANLGTDAVGALELLMDSELNREWARAAADACARIPTDAATKALLSRLDQKEVLAAVSAFAARFPRRAFVALAALSAGRGRNASTATALLSQLLRRDDGTLAGLAPSLPPAQARLVAELLAKSGPVEDARPEELHRVLSSPPWLSTKKGVAAKVVDNLAPLPFVASIAWDAGQQQSWQDEAPVLKMPEDEKRLRDRLDHFKVSQELIALIDGETPELRQLWEAEKQKERRWLWEGYLLGLPDPLPLMLWNELPANLFHGSAEKHMLARYELAALPGLLDRVGRNAEKIEWLYNIAHPDIGILAAETLLWRKKGRAQAERWLRLHPEAALIGLVPVAVGRVGKLRSAAEHALRLIAGPHGRRALVLEIAGRYGRPEVSEAVVAVLETDPLEQVPARPPKLPAFWAPDTFSRPRLKASGRGLPLSAVDAVGTMLAFSQLDSPYGGIAILKDLCTSESLSAFAWDLFNAWLFAGAPSKEGWAFRQLGMLGDDDVARKLTPLIRVWPGESQAQRAVTGLDVLAGIGTDVALIALNGIAQKVKFKGLQDAAKEKIQAIAEARGFTPEELADRLVPDFNLDEQGTLVLDFGARQFRVGFDEQLRPFVRDAGNKVLSDLPKPNKQDDADKAKEAVETWKTLKKDVKTIAAQQVLRLEMAMCSQRRWSAEVFRLFLAGHPLLGHLVRRLVWGAFEETGALRQLFRVAEDGSFADANDDLFDLPDDLQVGVVHALSMSPAQTAQLGQVFADYQIIQPFRQLGREVFTLSDAERAAIRIERLKGVTIPVGKVLGLTQRAWRRGPAQDAGFVWWLERPIPIAGYEVRLYLNPGIATGMVEEFADQQLEGATIVRQGSWSHSAQGDLAFGQLDPITASEVIGEIEGLR